MVCAIWINLSVVSCCCNSFGARDVTNYLEGFPDMLQCHECHGLNSKLWIPCRRHGLSWKLNFLIFQDLARVVTQWTPSAVRSQENRFVGTERSSRFFPCRSDTMTTILTCTWRTIARLPASSIWVDDAISTTKSSTGNDWFARRDWHHPFILLLLVWCYLCPS